MRRLLYAFFLVLLPGSASAQVLPFFPKSLKQEAIARDEIASLLRETSRVAARSVEDTTVGPQLVNLFEQIRQTENAVQVPARLSMTATGALFGIAASKDSSDNASANAAIGLQLQTDRSQWDLMMSIAAIDEEVREGFGQRLFSAASGQRGMLISYQRASQPYTYIGGNAPPRALGWTAQLGVTSMRWRDTMGSTPVVVAAAIARGTYDLFRAMSTEKEQSYGVRFDAGLTTRLLTTSTRADRHERRRMLGSGQMVFPGVEAGMSVVFGQALLGARLTWMAKVPGFEDVAGLTGLRFGTSIIVQPQLTPLPVRFH